MTNEQSKTTLVRRAMPLAFLGAAAAASVAVVAGSARAFQGAERTGTTGDMQLFVILYRPGPAWIAGKPTRQQALGPHGRYMGELLERGVLFAGGGFVESDGGMALIRAENVEEARALLAADPAVTNGIMTCEILRWRPRFRTDDPLPASN